eukprot:scaffold1389_cov251-Ochromonas_danica.AAC.3
MSYHGTFQFANENIQAGRNLIYTFFLASEAKNSREFRNIIHRKHENMAASGLKEPTDPTIAEALKYYYLSHLWEYCLNEDAHSRKQIPSEMDNPKLEAKVSFNISGALNQAKEGAWDAKARSTSSMHCRSNISHGIVGRNGSRLDHRPTNGTTLLQAELVIIHGIEPVILPGKYFPFPRFASKDQFVSLLLTSHHLVEGRNHLIR